MSLRNRLLLCLMGEPGAMAPLEQQACDIAPENRLLVAMCSVRARDIAALIRHLDEADTCDVVNLSLWCLFIGLTEDPAYGLDLFDVLRAHDPFAEEIWSDLATLQAASGYTLQAARSAAVHAALTGRIPPVDELPLRDVKPEARSGRLRFIKGDSSSFSGR